MLLVISSICTQLTFPSVTCLDSDDLPNSGWLQAMYHCWVLVILSGFAAAPLDLKLFASTTPTSATWARTSGWFRLYSLHQAPLCSNCAGIDSCPNSSRSADRTCHAVQTVWVMPPIKATVRIWRFTARLSRSSYASGSLSHMLDDCPWKLCSPAPWLPFPAEILETPAALGNLGSLPGTKANMPLALQIGKFSKQVGSSHSELNIFQNSVLNQFEIKLSIFPIALFPLKKFSMPFMENVLLTCSEKRTHCSKFHDV